MNLALLMTLQAAAPAATIDFDLATYRPSQAQGGCASQDADEIVVCAPRRRREGAYPFEEMARKFGEEPIRAEMGLGGVAKARAYVESVEMPGGQISKRVMIGVKLPF